MCWFLLTDGRVLLIVLDDKAQVNFIALSLMCVLNTQLLLTNMLNKTTQKHLLAKTDEEENPQPENHSNKFCYILPQHIITAQHKNTNYFNNEA